MDEKKELSETVYQIAKDISDELLNDHKLKATPFDIVGHIIRVYLARGLQPSARQVEAHLKILRQLGGRYIADLATKIKKEKLSSA